MKKRKCLFFILSCVVTFALHYKFEFLPSGFPELPLVNILNKLNFAFHELNFADLLVLAAAYLFFCRVAEQDERVDVPAAVLSFAAAVLLLFCVSFQKYNKTWLVLYDSYQLMTSFFCALGLGMVFYLGWRLFCHCFERACPAGGIGEGGSGRVRAFLDRHFLAFGFLVIFLSWLTWILLNYPGTDCPDSNVQLEQFWGNSPWSVSQPPASTAVMGSMFYLGYQLFDANFGFFLYCFLQTCVGAFAFSLSMKKLRQLGIPFGWCALGVAFFAFTPLWGTYAQWLEKDLLYAEAATLQAVFLLEILKSGKCTLKSAGLMTAFGLLASLLRYNGIYAILPALVCLLFLLKGAERKKSALSLLVFVLAYEGITLGLYSLLGIGKPSMGAEAYSIPFQQTARYVRDYGDEVTEYEREVIDSVLRYDDLVYYDPVISDPVKNCYRGTNLSEYNKVWFLMFWKHPGCYFEAFFNNNYGYLAPVSQNIEAWIGKGFYGFVEMLGCHRVISPDVSQILVQVWFLSMRLPLVKYLCTPGMYTWIVLALAIMLLRRRRYGALILFIPSLMNILVCLASPMTDAIRYELPTVAATPLLIGWAYWSLHREQS